MNLVADTFQFLLADFLTVTKYAGRFTPHNFCWHIFWQSLHMPADLPPQFLLEDLMTVNKSTARFTPPISASRFFWQSPNLSAFSHQIFWQIYTPQFLLAYFLTVTKSPGRFPSGRLSDWQIWSTCWQIPPNFCWQIFRQFPNLLPDSLLADLLTGKFGEPAGRYPPIFISRFSDSH